MVEKYPNLAHVSDSFEDLWDEEGYICNQCADKCMGRDIFKLEEGHGLNVFTATPETKCIKCDREYHEMKLMRVSLIYKSYLN
jgi:hypothetical protein